MVARLEGHPVSVESPLHALILGPKRHVEFRMGRHGATIVDTTEAQLGGTYADPPAMGGRSMEGPRRWSVAAAEREIALTLARLDDIGALRPGAPWDRGCASRCPTMRRLSVRTPEMARALPGTLGPRPGTRYVEGVVDPLRREVSPTPVALDPGGPLEDPQALSWVDRATGEPLRVTTDPMDLGAVLLETLDARASRWSRPSPAQPIDSVRPNRLLLRRVGRASGVIDAEADGMDDLDRRRPVMDDGDPGGFVVSEARRMGPTAFFRRYSVPLRTSERIASGGWPSPTTIARVLGSLSGHSPVRTCSLHGCDEVVVKLNALYCSTAHADRAYRLRKKANEEGPRREDEEDHDDEEGKDDEDAVGRKTWSQRVASRRTTTTGTVAPRRRRRRASGDDEGSEEAPKIPTSDPFAGVPSCGGCGTILLGDADRGGVCRSCEGRK